eukprot:359936-Chlamydomonas_euryale.AAC.11
MHKCLHALGLAAWPACESHNAAATAATQTSNTLLLWFQLRVQDLGRPAAAAAQGPSSSSRKCQGQQERHHGMVRPQGFLFMPCPSD